jgi:hypothetical protein
LNLEQIWIQIQNGKENKKKKKKKKKGDSLGWAGILSRGQVNPCLSPSAA